MEKLIKHLLDENQSVIKKFEDASIQGEGTPQEVADFREMYVHDFLEKYFPLPHKITKGIIHDSYGNHSSSIDCVIVNPKHPKIISSRDKFAYILADGVDSCIEIKPDIQNKCELVRGLVQIRSVKKLRRVNASYVQWDTQITPNEVIDFSKQIPNFLFTLKAKSKPIETVEEIIGYYYENKVPLKEQFDYIIIHNVGIISNYKSEKFNLISPPEEKRFGWFFEEWNENTLIAFLLYLNIVPPAEVVMTMPVLFNYLQNIKPKNLTRIGLADTFFEETWPTK